MKLTKYLDLFKGTVNDSLDLGCPKLQKDDWSLPALDGTSALESSVGISKKNHCFSFEVGIRCSWQGIEWRIALSNYVSILLLQLGFFIWYPSSSLNVVWRYLPSCLTITMLQIVRKASILTQHITVPSDPHGVFITLTLKDEDTQAPQFVSGGAKPWLRSGSLKSATLRTNPEAWLRNVGHSTPAAGWHCDKLCTCLPPHWPVRGHLSYLPEPRHACHFFSNSCQGFSMCQGQGQLGLGCTKTIMPKNCRKKGQEEEDGREKTMQMTNRAGDWVAVTGRGLYQDEGRMPPASVWEAIWVLCKSNIYSWWLSHLSWVLPCFLRQVLSLTLGLTVSALPVGQQAPESTVSVPLYSDYRCSKTLGFIIGFGFLCAAAVQAQLLTCAHEALPAAPSSSPFLIFPYSLPPAPNLLMCLQRELPLLCLQSPIPALGPPLSTARSLPDTSDCVLYLFFWILCKWNRPKMSRNGHEDTKGA